MSTFSHGPFSLDPAPRGVSIGGTQSRRWTLNYGDTEIAQRTLPESLARSDVIESFGDDRAQFMHSVMSRREKPAAAKPPELVVSLVRSSDSVGSSAGTIGAFVARAEIPGLTAGLIDDRYPTWLVSSSHPSRSLPMSIDEFYRLRAAHEAISVNAVDVGTDPDPANAWIADLLPVVVMTTERDEWRAPTSWELRHVVGEGSFTGATNAADLVGVMPQNFRKYTARDDAKSRQAMSFAMWHLLLIKLGVTRA